MSAAAVVSVRDEMSKYWRQHSSEGNLQEMLLDNDAEDIAREETPEILSMLPDYENKDVVELGAGIGRFTSSLSEQSKSVVAVDFMQNFIEKNKETNDHYGNTEFICADVTHLDLPASSADIVFSNWLLMYLSNDEIVNLGRKMLSWLRNDGYFFFRESCFHKSGSKARENDFNPTQYRNPAEYISLLERAVLPAENGNGSYAFEMVLSKNVQTYLKMKQNKNQVCWLLKKVRVDTVHNHGYKTFQEFLDTQQYSRNKILTYEKIFGRHFISTGGKETTEEFCKMLDLQPGQKVLDVGCGIGGGAFHMAQRYDVSVLGVDLSENAVSIAWERCLEFMDSRVEFEVADATKRDYPAESFDVVYSRDTILHIDDKLALFKKFYKWLKPGGKLFITDYCCSDGEHSNMFKDYVERRGYILYSPPKYGKIIESAGFVNVKADDRTTQFSNILHRELGRFEGMKEEFLQEFTEADYEYITDDWKTKLIRVKEGSGEQRWGLFYAEKPRS